MKGALVTAGYVVVVVKTKAICLVASKELSCNAKIIRANRLVKRLTQQTKEYSFHNPSSAFLMRMRVIPGQVSLTVIMSRKALLPRQLQLWTGVILSPESLARDRGTAEVFLIHYFPSQLVGSLSLYRRLGSRSWAATFEM